MLQISSLLTKWGHCPTTLNQRPLGKGDLNWQLKVYSSYLPPLLSRGPLLQGTGAGVNETVCTERLQQQHGHRAKEFSPRFH
jgi:hypothetical protein